MNELKLVFPDAQMKEDERPRGDGEVTQRYRIDVPEIRRLSKASLPDALSVIRQSFATVAEEFHLTAENCPSHTSFMTLEKLRAQWDAGQFPFGLYAADRLTGCVSLSKEGERVWELRHLAVLPAYRRRGYGGMLLGFTKDWVITHGGDTIRIGIIEESELLKNWYAAHGFTHIGTRKFEHLPFTAGFMEWRAR